MFLILSGRTVVYATNAQGERIYLASMTAGDFFGENSFFTGALRSATVEASETLSVLEIDRTLYDTVMAGNPEASNVLLRFYKERIVDSLLATSTVFGLLESQARKALIDKFKLLVLEVDQILVANAYRNTADRGQTAALSHIWNDTLCMVCRVMNDGMDGDLEAPEAHIGRSIFSTKNSEPLPGTSDDGSESLIIEEYREEARRGGVIRARNKRQVKILHAEAGHLISAVTA